MTARGFYTLLFGALMLFTALSVGSAGAFLLGTAALLCWALSLLCVCAAALSCRAEQQLEGGQTQRGGTCRLILRGLLCRFFRRLAPRGELVRQRPYLRRGRAHNIGNFLFD